MASYWRPQLICALLGTTALFIALLLLSAATDSATSLPIQRSLDALDNLGPPNPITSLSGSKPVFVFVAGVEGSGHHLVAQTVFQPLHVFREAPDDVVTLLAELWEPTLDDALRPERMATLNDKLKALASQMASPEVQPRHLVVQKSKDMLSFPYDVPRNPLRRPDLLELRSMVEPHFELKILVTSRHPHEAVASLIKRGWWSKDICVEEMKRPTRKGLFSPAGLGGCGHLGVQGRVVEDALVYLNAQLQTLGPRYYRVLPYDKVTKTPLEFAGPLSEFLGVPQTALRVGLSKVKPNHGHQLKPQEVQVLELIFTKTKQEQWKFMEDQAVTLTPNLTPKPSLIIPQE